MTRQVAWGWQNLFVERSMNGLADIEAKALFKAASQVHPIFAPPVFSAYRQK